MPRRVDHLPGGSFLDDPAQVHHTDPIGVARCGGEIVGDHQDAHSGTAQRAEQLEHTRPHRRVEHRHRFIGDEQRRFEHQCRRHSDTLALAPGEFVRKPVQIRLGRPDADAFECTHHRFAMVARDLVDLERLTHQALDREARIERLVRVLEHQLGTAAVDPALGRRQSTEIDAVEAHGTCRHIDQTHHGHRRGGLAATRLAHERHHLARPDLERHAIDGADRSRIAASQRVDESTPLGEHDRQFVDLEEGSRVGHGRIPGRQQRT